MEPRTLKLLAQQLLSGQVAIEEFLHLVGSEKTADLGEIQLDLDRGRRCGFPEVIFAEGKTAAAIEKIIQTFLDQGVDTLATRLSAEQAQELLPKFPTAYYNPIGRTFRVPVEQTTSDEKQTTSDEKRAEGFIPSAEESLSRQGHVAIITAGTSDLPVAEEARETALWTGARVTIIHDAGVAGPHRLAEKLPLLRDADAVVVVAGMEGALPSVVGGHVACPVIAVPTSIGYGASFGGVAALLSMLNSCAANVAVVNIDAGFKGGYLAGLIAKNAVKARRKQP
jgi:pyridinium-3,5-biscarboxylic acid mononucleotide synthase